MRLLLKAVVTGVSGLLCLGLLLFLAMPLALGSLYAFFPMLVG